MSSDQPHPKNLSVTLTDVARLAGVSPMTVSRVVNTPHRVSAPTVERVRAAATKLGYVRNRLAGSLRSNRSQLVAAIVPALSSPVFSDMIQALTDGLTSHGYHLIVAQTGYESPREDEVLSDILSRRPDAVVLTGTSHSRDSKRQLLSANIPVLETWDLTSQPIDMLIGFSHEAVGAAVSEHFVKAGRRRLAMVGADDTRSHRRWLAFAKRTQELGLPHPEVHFVSAPARLGDGRRGLAALLEKSPEVDAIFCSSDMLAAGVLIEARALGLHVPHRLGVVGFGDLNFAGDLEPALTSVRVDATGMGRLAADILVQRLNGESVPHPKIDLSFEIVARTSG